LVIRGTCFEGKTCGGDEIREGTHGCARALLAMSDNGTDHRIVLVVIEVSDVQRSARLYEEAFGIRLHLDDHEGAVHGSDDRWTSGLHAAHSWTDGAFLHFALYPAKEDGPTSNVQIGLSVEDLRVADERAVRHGAEVVHAARPEPWGPTSRYRDYDGNAISLTEVAGRDRQ
jgi:predicted enzyme related to lactoylglutathione lyase